MPDNPPLNQPTADEQRSGTNTLRVENAALAKGFTLIPNYILRAKGISRDAKMLYGILLSYAWQTDSCFPGYDRLMEDMQCQSQALSKYIKELKTVGLIDVQRRGQGMTSLYTLKDMQGENVQDFENQSASSLKIKELEVPESKTKNTQGKKHKEEYPSNIRKAPTQHENGANEVAAEQTTALSRIRQSSSEIIEGDTGRHTPDATSSTARGGNLNAVGDMLPTRRGRPTATEAEARRAIRQYIEDYARELGDQAPKSSVTRAVNLMREADVSVGTFIAAMQAAKKRTQQRSANIVKMAEGGKSPYPQKIKMPYFFSMLEDELGLKEPQPATGARRP